MSRLDGPRKPPVGSRVVLRYRRPPGSTPSQSDALGILVALDPAVVVRSADGAEVSVEPEQVVVLKSVPPRPVRTSAVRNLEHAIVMADADAETEWVQGWVARAGSSATHGGARSVDPLEVDPLEVDAAVALADPSMPEWDFFHDLLGVETLRALEHWFAQRDLPLTLRLPDRLVRPPSSWTTFGRHSVLAAKLPLVATRGSTTPGGATRGGTTRSAAFTVEVTGPLSAQVDGSDDRPAVGVRLAAAPDERVWAVVTTGSSAVAASDQGASQRNELATALALACEWAHGEGASDACVAVPDDDDARNAAARGAGFADHHGCRYVRLAAAE